MVPVTRLEEATELAKKSEAEILEARAALHEALTALEKCEEEVETCQEEAVMKKKSLDANESQKRALQIQLKDMEATAKEHVRDINARNELMAVETDGLIQHLTKKISILEAKLKAAENQVKEREKECRQFKGECKNLESECAAQITKCEQLSMSVEALECTVQSLEVSTSKYLSPDTASSLKAEADSLRNEMSTARGRLSATMGLKATSSHSWDDLVSKVDFLTEQAQTHKTENLLLKATMREEIQVKSAATPTRVTPLRGRPPALPPRDNVVIVADTIGADTSVTVATSTVMSTISAAFTASKHAMTDARRSASSSGANCAGFANDAASATYPATPTQKETDAHDHQETPRSASPPPRARQYMRVSAFPQKEKNAQRISGVGLILERPEGSGLLIVKGLTRGGVACGDGRISVNDTLLKVNNVAVTGVDVHEVLALIQGPEGSDVTLHFRQPRSLSLRSPVPRRRTSLETGVYTVTLKRKV